MSIVERVEPVITCEGVRKVFGQKRQRVVALDHIDLKLWRGELTLLMGPSGSGKSSIIASLGGLQKPDGGTVKAFDQNLWANSNFWLNRFRRQHCGFVFQAVGLFPALTAIDQIILPLSYLGFDSKTAKRAAEKALDDVGLSNRQFSRPDEMSGGENQRVALARMLAKSPALIFCDEPTSALDGKNGANVAGLLRQAASDYNAMILCVTHDERLRPFADRILEIEDGRIISDSKKELQS
ncbi:MAG: ABC transporter ATP-binding protein [Alphaproteobacteria bacterium]